MKDTKQAGNNIILSRLWRGRGHCGPSRCVDTCHGM